MHRHTGYTRIPLALLIILSTIRATPSHGAGTPESASQMSPAPLQQVPLQQVTVVDTLPVPGVEQPRHEVPAAVQAYTDAAIDRSQALTLTDFLQRRVGGVHVNEIQNNPFQPDVNYRGFTASPLLGTPQGLSVYLDGVRLNQPFGEVVSWDLIPRSALASVVMMPGSNPLFGLNTLGGALSLHTKDGRTHAGTALQAIYGTQQRRAIEFEHGGSKASGLHWFHTGTLHNDDGWRDDSPSSVRQWFSKIGWADRRTDIALGFAYANNELTGNGLQEAGTLARDYSSVYTRPDITRNESWLLNLTGRHTLNDEVLISGNTYYRRIRTSTFNGDFNDDALDQSIYQPTAAERAALAAAGYTGVPASGATAANTPFPYWRCIANVLLNDEPAEKCTGLINRTRTAQDNYGATGQFTWLGAFAGARHQLTGGAAYDAARMDFSQTTQLGYVNPDRTITGLDAYADGLTGGNVDGVPYDTRVALHGESRTWSVYGTDTATLADHWHFTVSGRYNRTDINNTDRINPGGGARSLDGQHTYSRFNPAAGMTYAPSAALSLYAGYNEGSRTPSSIELGCANPAQPCRLPNAMAGDPPLRQVVTRTWEAGFMGALTRQTFWNAGVFHARSTDDILFVASGTTNGAGYFKNFGETLRQGAELGITHAGSRFAGGLHYTWLAATFESPETVGGAGNSTNDAGPGLEGNIRVRPGHHIPLMPRHNLKASADYRFTPEWSAGVTMTALSGAYARGNENNLHQPDGTYYLGSGRNSGYAIFDFTTRYQTTPQLALFARISNLLDRRFETAAQLAPLAFGPSGGIVARPFPPVGTAYPLVHSTFLAPGAPRTGWIGLRYQWERRKERAAPG